MILNKEQLINLVKSMTYEEGFLVTVEEVDNKPNNGYFLRIVTEEMGTPIEYQGLEV